MAFVGGLTPGRSGRCVARRDARKGRAARVARMSMSPEETREKVSDKTYQLEELEDKEHMTTALYLNADGSVDCGATTGPVPKEASGEWMLDPESKRFAMTLKRVFEENKGDYLVERLYDGEMIIKEKSELIECDGKMIMQDFPVGFFKMISAADDLPEEHFRGV